VNWSPFEKRGVLLSIKREDMLDLKLGGNKVYKLYGHLRQAKKCFGSKLKLASFGGAWSNHLYALGAAAQQLGLPSLAIVRGEEPRTPSAMLSDIRAMGTEINYVSRSDYRQFTEWANEEKFLLLNEMFGEHYWIPEGGGGEAGTRVYSALTEAIVEQSDLPVDLIAHACGTGTSLAGLMLGENPGMAFLGVAVLNAGDAIEEQVSRLLSEAGKQKRSSSVSGPRWEIDTQSHCGGYAKLPPYLIDFMHRFESETGVVLDPVYTAKLMYGLTRRAEAGEWRPGTHVVAVHSGGLQGRRGWPCFHLENKPHST